MKNYNHHLAKQLILKFRTYSIFFFCLALNHSSSYAQISKTFTKEIEVQPGVTLVSNVPAAIGLNMSGTMSSNNTKSRYSFSGKNGDVRVNILKDLEIETWDKNIIKQETLVTIKAATNEDARMVMDQLQLKLEKGADNRIVADCNLNIALFLMKNGFFKADDCEIQLDNGRKYAIEYLELETRLSIPKSINVSIVGKKNCTIRLGELNGDLDLDLKYAEVFGTNVRNLRASLKSCYHVFFDQVEAADISSSNSYVKIDQVGSMKIGSQSLNDACDLPHLRNQRSKSAQTKYKLGTVGILSVNDSANDEIIIDEVGEMSVKNTSYTDFEIDRLNTSLLLEAKSSDLTISKIAREFSQIDINNSLSTIALFFETGANYTLKVNRNNYTEGLNDTWTKVSQDDDDKDVYKIGKSDKGGLVSINCDRCKFDIH